MLEAYAAAKEAGRKKDGLSPAVELIVRWAQTNHAEWFDRYQEIAPPTDAPTQATPTEWVAQLRRLAQPEPDQPRWRPTF